MECEEFINRGQPGTLVFETTTAGHPTQVNLARKVLPLSFLECEEFINRGQPGALVYKTTTAGQPKQVNLAKKVTPLSFLECEELGDANPKRCGSCNNCRVCSTRDDEVTKTQSTTNDEVTKTQPITEKMSDLRGYITMPLPC